MLIYLAKQQRVDSEEASGPNTTWENESEGGGVKHFEQVWLINCTPEVVMGGTVDLLQASEMSKKVSRIEGAVDVSFRVIVNPNTQRPHQFIKIEDNYDVIKDVLLELGEDPGTSEIMMQAIIDIGQNTEVIKFTNLQTTVKDSAYNFVDKDNKEMSCQRAWECLCLIHEDVRITLAFSTSDQAELSINEIASQGLNILQSGMNYDMNILCLGGETIPCHKNILASNSSVMETELSGNFLEAKSSTIKMNYECVEVNAMLKFLYCRDLQAAVSSVSVAVKLLQMANYYSISNLWERLVFLLESTEFQTVPADICLELFSFLNLVTSDADKSLNHHDRIKRIILKIVYALCQRFDDLGDSEFHQMYNKDGAFQTAWNEYLLLALPMDPCC